MILQPGSYLLSVTWEDGARPPRAAFESALRKSGFVEIATPEDPPPARMGASPMGRPLASAAARRAMISSQPPPGAVPPGNASTTVAHAAPPRLHVTDALRAAPLASSSTPGYTPPSSSAPSSAAHAAAATFDRAHALRQELSAPAHAPMPFGHPPAQPQAQGSPGSTGDSGDGGGLLESAAAPPDGGDSGTAPDTGPLSAWARWTTWGSPFAEAPGRVSAQALAAFQVAGASARRAPTAGRTTTFAARVTTPTVLRDIPEAAWAFVHPLTFSPFESTFTSPPSPLPALRHGGTYEIAFTTRDKDAPREPDAVILLGRLGFASLALVRMMRNGRIPGRPESVSSWVALARWDGPDAVLSGEEPAYFSRITEAPL